LQAGWARRLPVAAGALLAAALVYVSFRAKGGSELARTTEVETWLALAGGVLCATALLLSPRTRPSGVLPACLFMLLGLLTALSIEWSVSPGESWIEANRTLAYAAVFLGGIALGNLAWGAAETIADAVLAAATVVVGYALASRVWPAELADLDIYARIGQPFGYWNAVGVTAAVAFVPAVWLASRRRGSAAISALGYPAAGLLTVALFLTYSRSATAAAAVAVALWLLAVPLRLRSVAVLIAAGASALPVLLWATGKAAFTEDGVELAIRESAATPFGLRLAALVALLYAVGYAVAAGRPRVEITQQARQRAGALVVAAIAVVAVVTVGVVATSDRGLSGTVADRWHELRTDEVTATGGPSRLGSASSSRGRYWREAVHVFEDEPLRGVGAGGFATAALRYRSDANVSRHAHGYVVQTLADLGLVGLLAILAAAAAWLAAAARALWGPLRAETWTRERTAAAVLFLAVLAYGIQSAVDWTWSVPGPTVMALLAAGFVAGRGRGGEGGSAAPRFTPVRIGFAAVAVLASLAAVWSIAQPNRADRLADNAVRLAGVGALEAALDDARHAQDIDPLAVKPLFAEAAVHQRAGRDDLALEVFRRVVAEHPNDPQAWLRLADFQLYELDEPRQALAALNQALYRDPMSEAVRDSFIEARTRLRSRGLLPPEATP
jgi:hypothetical protein